MTRVKYAPVRRPGLPGTSWVCEKGPRATLKPCAVGVSWMRQSLFSVKRKTARAVVAGGSPVNCLDCPSSVRRRFRRESQLDENPQRSGFQSSGLGLSHLTVIRTHTLFDHLLSSVAAILNDNKSCVKNYFYAPSCGLTLGRARRGGTRAGRRPTSRARARRRKSRPTRGSPRSRGRRSRRACPLRVSRSLRRAPDCRRR